MPPGFHPPAALAPSRRLLLGCGAGWLVAGRAWASVRETHAPSAISPVDALKRLTDGNARFARGGATHPDGDPLRRRSLVGAQHPFATILACADSRVAPELIFDQGLGDLFVIRVAGNVVDDTVLASIEYSVIHLGSPLVMVLGHQRCGAVTAAVQAVAGKGSPDDKDTKIGALADLITPAVRAVPPQAPDKLDAAIVLNAERAARAVLTGSPPLRARVQSGALRVVSARYDLELGTLSHLQTAHA